MRYLVFDEFVVPDIARFIKRSFLIVFPAYDNYFLHYLFAFFKCLVYLTLEFYDFFSTQTFISRYDPLRLAVVNASSYSFRRKAAEYNRMYCTDTGTGKHCKYSLWYHWQIHCYTIATIYA
jgi:hypothetical protein